MKEKFSILVVFFLLLLLYPIPQTQNPTFAQSQSCVTQSTNPQAEGLISSLNAPIGFGNSQGICATGQDVIFNQFKSYDDLKSIFYDQSKAPKESAPPPLTYTGDKVYLASTDLVLTTNPSGSGVIVVFVPGSLTFTNNYTYGTSDGTKGTVFIAKNDIIITSNVTQIDAVLIAGGTIYTAGSGCSTNSVSTSPLTVNGSLIALGQPIKFCRTLTDNTGPAEVINQQPKYLVILKNLFSQPLQIWTEVAGAVALPPASSPAPVAPTVTTVAADNITATSARLNANINPNGASTNGWYKYENIDRGSCDALVNSTSSNGLGSGYTSVTNPITISGLLSNTRYFFCAKALNSNGTTLGNVLDFTTLSPPSPSPSPSPSPPPGPPSFDSATSAAVSGSTGAVTLSWNHTTSSLGNRLLAVGISINNNSNQTVGNVTYGVTDLTFWGAVNNGTTNRVELWYLKNPVSGTNPITVTLTASARMTAGSSTWTNVNQTTPLGTFVSATGTSATPSVNVSSAINEFVVDVLAAGNGTTSTAVTAAVGAGQTQLWNLANSCGGCAKVTGAGSREVGNALVTMSWGLNASRPWAIGAVAIKPF